MQYSPYVQEECGWYDGKGGKRNDKAHLWVVSTTVHIISFVFFIFFYFWFYKVNLSPFESEWCLYDPYSKMVIIFLILCLFKHFFVPIKIGLWLICHVIVYFIVFLFTHFINYLFFNVSVYIFHYQLFFPTKHFI